MRAIAVPAAVEALLCRLRTAGYAAHPVGGCVRDSLLGLTPGDWDVCTSALPEEVKALFPDLRVLETGLRHGTVTLLTDFGGVEVTTFRRDGAYEGHRRPEQVSFVSDLREDLARRDFTVNAMALGPGGEVIDPFGGQEDLKRGILRCVGEAALRFREDGLRILRGLRFMARFGLQPEDGTARAMEACGEYLTSLSAERVLQELLGILRAKAPGAVPRPRQALLACCIPALRAVPPEDWASACRELDMLPAEGTLRLTRLLLPLGREAAEKALQALRCDNVRKIVVLQLLEASEKAPPASRPAAAALLAKLGEAGCFALCRLWRSMGRGEGVSEAEALVRRILDEQLPLHVRELALGGRELMELGFPPGPELGRVLEALLGKVWSGDVKNASAALLAAAEPYKMRRE